jgi:hypothetical protein
VRHTVMVLPEQAKKDAGHDIDAIKSSYAGT